VDATLDRGIFEAIEAHCKRESGYTALADVRPGCRDGNQRMCFGAHDSGNTERGDPEIGQPSYFLAETLKYLLLMFGSPERLRLDDVVFTTEGESDLSGWSLVAFPAHDRPAWLLQSRVCPPRALLAESAAG
jgi:hypothetical protein